MFEKPNLANVIASFTASKSLEFAKSCSRRNEKKMQQQKPKRKTQNTHTHAAVLDIYAKVAQDLIQDPLVPKQVSRSSKKFQSYATPKSCKKAH